MRTLSVTNAKYIAEHKLQLFFSDETVQILDFGPFLLSHPHPQHDKYYELENFRQFHIERGNVVWGEDWDLIFPVAQLHKGYLAPAVY